MKSAKIFVFALLAFAFGLAPALAQSPYVLRPKYPQVKPITTEELNRQYEQAVIVDTRSNIEYDVVHVSKAHFIPVALGTFMTEVAKLRAKNATNPLVFYCNGYDCAKSFEAAVQAMNEGFSNVFCYDAGIYDWAKAHPEKTTLMGRTPSDKNKLLTAEALKARKISWAEFRKRADDPNAMVIDIREPFQRDRDAKLPQNQIPAVPNLRNIPSDRLVPLLNAKEFKDKTLLITDAVGKQVQWMQYYLEENGYKNYYFLDNGILSAAEAGAVVK